MNNLNYQLLIYKIAINYFDKNFYYQVVLNKIKFFDYKINNYIKMKE